MPQGAAGLLQRQQDQLHAARVDLAAHLADAVLVVYHKRSRPFITLAAHAAFSGSVRLVGQLAQEAKEADQQHRYSSTVPAWKQALMALQQAAERGTDLDNGAGPVNISTEEVDRGNSSVEGLEQQWQDEVEKVVKNMLLWAQNVHGLEADTLPDSGKVLTINS